MSFDLRPSPLLPPFGGLADDVPENFIATGEIGLRGGWIYERETSVAVLEDLDAGMRADVEDALAAFERLTHPGDGGRVACFRSASTGYLVFQRHCSGVIRIEYAIDVLRGECLDPAHSPYRDEAIEVALRRWLHENEGEVVRAVDERSGAL